MRAIGIRNQPDRWVISIARSALDKDTLLGLLQTLQLERLAQKIDFDDSISGLAEQINTGWQQATKERFISQQP